METPHVYSLVTQATETRNLSFMLYLLPSAHGAFYSAQDTGKVLGEGGEGRELPGKWSLNEALPCAVAFLGLINISGMCL
ncbi:hypothetical protein RLOC_00009566 [Lonchura striata]|uniref:Uncharacterized protein n=1 Tax=Lonchura striata TaxID=40157 RepID=A0A218UIH1_9PASE|nr:hypothetical protein RLOC_00009566 [Lonchura striata domestica]